MTISGTVCHSGVAARPLALELFADLGRAPTCADTPDLSGEVEIPAGTCQSFSIVQPGFPTGRHEVRLFVDGDCQVAESSETNNARVATFTVP